MSLPAYGDLGREARDILTKNYHGGFIKVNIKSKTPIEVDLTGAGSTHIETGKLDGSLEAKYLLKSVGTTIKQKYTPNVVTTDATIKLPIEGSKLSLVNTMSLTSGFKNLVIKYGVQHPTVNLGLDVDLSKAGTQLTATAVTAHKNIQIGSQIIAKGKEVSKTTSILGYKCKDIAVHASAAYGSNMELGGTLYYKIRPHVVLGSQITWVPNAIPKCDIGCVTKVGKHTQLRGMISSTKQVGIGISQALRHGVTLTASAQASESCWKPKLGLNIEIDS